MPAKNTHAKSCFRVYERFLQKSRAQLGMLASECYKSNRTFDVIIPSRSMQYKTSVPNHAVPPMLKISQFLIQI